ncbi:MAG: endo-beta-N-acetylglucosaminidase [Mediterranea sp.]|jgi:hypothetical protein|nr:endo-beta-N-acetylglucosaminidase [Mediterranea sp.]
MRQLLISIVAIIAMAFGFQSCSNEENFVNEAAEQPSAQPVTRSATGIKNIVYVEVNAVNPLNAGSYTMGGEPFFDYVILFAANIRGDGNNAILYNNPNVQYILDHKETLIQPLQRKGIKVLLGLLGDHTGLGFANMNATQIEQFATAVSSAVTQYGLDGVDFDDEWAEYGRNGYPTHINGSYGNLLTSLRNKMPSKIITVYDFGNSNELSSVNALMNYGIYGRFGIVATSPGMGLPKSKYAPYVINFNQSNPVRTVKSNAQKVAQGGWGAIGYYDLKSYSHQAVLNAVAEGAFNSTCVYDGQSYPKNY